MDPSHQNILRQVRQKIIDDLDVYNGILSPLRAEFILKDEDINDIERGNSKEEKAQILLDILPRRGRRAFEIFHQSLKHQYCWLSDEIDKILAITINDVSHVYQHMQPVSPLTVTREEMIEKFKDALKDLQPNGYIALHGMKGFGKSCLTASILKDKDLTLKLFKNEIYWIKFGYNRDINEEILVQLNNLYHQIKSLNFSLESVNSECLEKSLKQAIENHFRKVNHRHALLILDDVCSKEVVDLFDFVCKTLVITADIGVLNKRNYSTVKMDHGFTEQETLGLFAKVLDIRVEQLPPEAKQIHAECKGMPLLIAMFAAQFKNFQYDMIYNFGRWKYYLDCLRTKNSKNKVIEEFMKIQEATFDMCIDQLEPEIRERYENLVIFSEDVNIMPKTLEILWDEKPYSVDDQMMHFCHKSLAAKKWNDDLRSYVYGVHDLLLCHLRQKLTAEQLRDKHKFFIDKCQSYCKGNFSKLPNDDYSFSYIGHHLEQAEMFEEFPKLYTDFDFLQAKINYTGLSDLFIDLKKYRKYITKNGDSTIESNIVDLEKFLENNANTLAKHRHMKCLDLVQIALDHSDGFVKDTAKKLASSRSSALYLSHERDMTNPYLDFCEEVITNASTIAFTDQPSHILVGSNDGKIILWDCNNRERIIFVGHDEQFAIKKIVLSTKGNHFLALSANGTMKLFDLSNIDYASDKYSIPVQSPQCKQMFWTGVFDSKRDDSIKTFTVVNERITDMKFTISDNKIIACTNSGTVRLWDIYGNHLWQDTCNKHHFGAVCLSSKDNLLHVMDETTSVIRIYKRKTDQHYGYVSQYNLQLDNPKIIYFSKIPEEDNCLIVVTDKISFYFKWFFKQEHIHSYEKCIKTEEKDKNTYYVAATLTYDARYLIIANSKGIISVMKAFNPDNLITYFKGNVTSLDSFWLLEENLHLICGSEKKWIHRWRITGDEKPKSVKKLLFDVKMENFGKDNFVVLKVSPTSMTARCGKETTATIESHHGRIVHIKLDNSAKKLIYVTEPGSVILYDMTSGQSSLIAKLDCTNSFIDVLRLENNYIALSKAGNNCLKVYQSVKFSKSIESANHVFHVHKITEDSVLTISFNEEIKYWLVKDLDWQELYRHIGGDGTVINSTLSDSKSYLALLKEEQSVTVYMLPDLSELQIETFKIETYLRHTYDKPVHICKFSQDEKYLAVALDNGDISIIELETKIELERLSLHSSHICQFHWSPTSISVPILLSVNCDEMAWWNVALLKSSDKSQNRRSRTGMFNRSVSSPIIGSGMSPRSSYRLTTSQSAELTTMKKEAGSAKMGLLPNFDEYWNRKSASVNEPQRPALLGCVQLPSSCTENVNVCVSDDFSQFLTVDIHGTISNYKLFINSFS